MIDEEKPGWYPQGKSIVFTSSREDNWEIYKMLAMGKDPVGLNG
jgi:Tol biopolymer transport system component